jgi:predicted MFS family arabinose efflux permease
MYRFVHWRFFFTFSCFLGNLALCGAFNTLRTDKWRKINENWVLLLFLIDFVPMLLLSCGSLATIVGFFAHFYICVYLLRELAFCTGKNTHPTLSTPGILLSLDISVYIIPCYCQCKKNWWNVEAIWLSK